MAHAAASGGHRVPPGVSRAVSEQTSTARLVGVEPLVLGEQLEGLEGGQRRRPRPAPPRPRRRPWPPARGRTGCGAGAGGSVGPRPGSRPAGVERGPQPGTWAAWPTASNRRRRWATRARPGRRRVARCGLHRDDRQQPGPAGGRWPRRPGRRRPRSSGRASGARSRPARRSRRCSGAGSPRRRGRAARRPRPPGSAPGAAAGRRSAPRRPRRRSRRGRTPPRDRSATGRRRRPGPSGPEVVACPGPGRVAAMPAILRPDQGADVTLPGPPVRRGPGASSTSAPAGAGWSATRRSRHEPLQAWRPPTRIRPGPSPCAAWRSGRARTGMPGGARGAPATGGGVVPVGVADHHRVAEVIAEPGVDREGDVPAAGDVDVAGVDAPACRPRRRSARRSSTRASGRTRRCRRGQADHLDAVRARPAGRRRRWRSWRRRSTPPPFGAEEPVVTEEVVDHERRDEQRPQQHLLGLALGGVDPVGVTTP